MNTLALFYIIISAGTLWLIGLMIFIFRGVADYFDKDDKLNKG